MSEKTPKYNQESLDEAANFAYTAMELGDSSTAGLADPNVGYGISSKITSRKGDITETNALRAPYQAENLISELNIVSHHDDPAGQYGGDSGVVNYKATTPYRVKRGDIKETKYQHGDSDGDVLPVVVDRTTLNAKTGLIEVGAVTRLTGSNAERAREIINRRNAKNIGRKAMEEIMKKVDGAKFE